jgi:hypothetical protein
LENKEKLINIQRNMRIITMLCLILPLIGFIASATFIRRPSQWTWDWEPIVILTMLAGATFFHLLWMVVVRKGTEMEFKKDPLRGYQKWRRLPFFGATSLIWGIVCYFLLWEWTISFVFIPIYIFLFLIIFNFNKGFYKWMDKVLRVVEKKEKRLKKKETRRKR